MSKNSISGYILPRFITRCLWQLDVLYMCALCSVYNVHMLKVSAFSRATDFLSDPLTVHNEDWIAIGPLPGYWVSPLTN
jgi:hypothetical protein